MLSFNSFPVRGMSALLSSLNHISNTYSRPLLSNAVDCTHYYPPSPQKMHHQPSMVKTATPKLAFICSSQRVCSTGELLIAADDEEASDAGEYNQSEVSVDSLEKTTLNKENEVGYSDSLETLDSKILKERIRRTKIGLANKGRVPWNKGKKHSAETRERIRQRTLEALRNPKVRNKMSEHPRTHSDQIKAKISYSLRRVWQERLKSTRLREQFFLSWVQSIAHAARKGGSGQEELDWDSYDKIKQQLEHHQLLRAEKKRKEKQMAIVGPKKFIKSWAKSVAKAAKKGGKGEQELDWDSYENIEQEMALHYQLQRSAEKAKAKEIARIRAERAAQIKAIKKVMLTQKRKEPEERTKERRDIKSQPYRKAKEIKDDSEVPQEFKLSLKLTKICTRKNTSGQVIREGEAFKSIFPSCKKLDLEYIKREKMRKEVSLADQIRAARNQKGKIQ